MESETKAVTGSFKERGLSDSTPNNFQSTMKTIERAFGECDNILGRAGMPTTGYVKQTEKIELVFDGMRILNSYALSAHSQVYFELDHPLFEGFANGATQLLSKIELNSIITENTFNMEENYAVGSKKGAHKIRKRIKRHLTLADFMGIDWLETDEEMPTLENIETVGVFAELFRLDYESMKPEGKNLNAYLKDILTDGEYFHRGYHPGRDFLSAVADVTIILPLVESIIGYDFITQEDLTGVERVLKGGGAALDVLTLWSSSVVANAAKAGAWGVTKAVLKTMTVDAIGSGAAYLTGEALEELGLPAGTSKVLAMLVSGAVTYSAGKYFFKDAAGNVVGEYTGEELDRILKGELGHSPDIPPVKGNAVDDLIEGGVDTTAYHTVDAASKAQSVLDGIDISYTSSESRFGQGFYVSAEGDTTVAELAAHGADAKYLIRYDMNLDGQKILDLTNQSVAADWGYLQNQSSIMECQKIAHKALNEGYSVIKVQSYRCDGINYIIYDNFEEILSPQMVTPVKP